LVNPDIAKSFPIVPAVLIENAIKYGTPGSNIQADISVQEGAAYLRVRNETELYVDPSRCFDRGARYAPAVEGAGFGLYLAREIVGAHRGAIECVPHDRIVEFAVRLPLEKVVI
jgi:signal transduction histidine kinase